MHLVAVSARQSAGEAIQVIVYDTCCRVFPWWKEIPQSTGHAVEVRDEASGNFYSEITIHIDKGFIQSECAAGVVKKLSIWQSAREVF